MTWLDLLIISQILYHKGHSGLSEWTWADQMSGVQSSERRSPLCSHTLFSTHWLADSHD